ncbi:MAG: Gfo/Idh/MocA family oxidoreductase [Bacteroidales bacterium]|nr:Gfo/Idh/MocA family oxidoreductase [Bacteroidales bacterium]
MDHSRRDFLKKVAVGTAGIAFAGPGLQARNVRNTPGANERVRVAVMGTNSRGAALARSVARSEMGEVAYICDVDERVVEETVQDIQNQQGKKPKGVYDFRRALDDGSLDALIIAAPDHWHTPAGIMALQAGKHVYVEKPCSHNSREGELFIQAQKKYDKVVQMGDQNRSSPVCMQAVQEVRNGIIGRPYYGKAEYARPRKSIGHGREAPVPEWLHYDLWQGPAPRTAYRDNVIHYNWHWFWRWGTGEINNNGIHPIDLMRWVMGIDTYPVLVSSSGGRFHYQDDWEFYDTQLASFTFNDRKMISWEGKSCTGYSASGGSIIYGTEGNMVLTRDSYEIYDLEGNQIKTYKGDIEEATDLQAGGDATDAHIYNLFKSIKNNTPNNSPIDEGHKSNVLCHLGNISQHVGRKLRINPDNGHILGDGEAMQMWGRTYEPGWEPKV